MMHLKFTKMHGLGNDFVVIDGINQLLPDTGLPFPLETLKHLGDRHFGIGFDQLLLIQPDTEADFRYRIFNCDGSEVSQCGNGARCFARFVHDRGLTDKNDIRVMTAAGPLLLQLQDDKQVRVNMGAPRWTPSAIPMQADTEANHYSLQTSQGHHEVAAVGLGNPHAVLQVDNVDTAPVTTLGPLLETHPAFPERANIGFMQVLDPSHIRLRVFERGAGETLACGSGACAAVVCGQRLGLLEQQVDVAVSGGKLQVKYAGTGSIYMTGPAESVYDGQIDVATIQQ